MNEIIKRLDELAEAQARKTLLNIDKQNMIDRVLTAEIKTDLAAIDAEFENPENGINIQIAELTNEIKALTVLVGKSQAGTYLKAIYVKGRQTWNTKGLFGYAVDHPEIGQFLKVGKPHARIGEVKS